SLQTVDGVFTFGAVVGAGYEIVLNDLPILVGFAVDLMTVHSHGQLFLRSTDASWYLWTGNQFNSSTGPTAAPVPIGATFSPKPHIGIPASSPIGTHVADVNVIMSDGGAFSGTI